MVPVAVRVRVCRVADTKKSKLLPKAKVVSNHLLIDPAAAVFDRTAEEYQPLRQALVSARSSLEIRSLVLPSLTRVTVQRREVLRAIATANSTRDVTWIFTDQQSSSELGSSSAKDYQDAAAMRGSPFVSVVLVCDLDENLARAAGADRGNGANTKLTDLGILRSIRESEDIFRFGDDYELELDVTRLTPSEAAAKVCEHVGNLFGVACVSSGN